MTGWQAPDVPPDNGVYAGPPPTRFPAQPAYPVAPPPPGYGYGYGYPTGYPGPGYPPAGPGAHPGYPPYPYAVADPRDARPGLALASAVLGYVNSGLLILGGLLLLLGASVLSSFENAFGKHTHYGLELSIDAVVNLIATALLVPGSVMIGGRKITGRTLLSVGAGVVVAESVYWLIRFPSAFEGLVFYAGMFAAVAILSVVFAWTRPVSAWLHRSSAPQR